MVISMINEVLFERIKKLCGSFFTGEVEESVIRKYENLLEITFPNGYVEFIKRFGEGGVSGTYIYGVEDEGFASVLKHTEAWRKKGIIPHEHIVVVHGGKKGIEELICLDTSRMVDGECPAVQYMLKDNEVLSVVDYATDFWDVFNKENEIRYMQSGIKREQKESCDNKGLPLGMGFGCSWMVVEGVSQKAIVEALIEGKTTKHEYKDGVKLVAKAESDEQMVAITATYKKQNCVIGHTVHRFFYETERFLKLCKDFPRVYVYMTEHVSETHGFALIENGKLMRMFSYDEENIINTGERLPEEIALSYQLPKSFDDVYSKDENITQVTGDVLVNLATQQTGVDIEQYPYKNVTVGKLKRGGEE